MRRSVFKRILPGALLAVGLCILVAVDAAVAQKAARPDTSDASGKTSEEPSGRVKISIDESGISIEGRANVDETQVPDSEDTWVEVHDERGKLKQKGLDIVKFGESVFVAKDELVRGDLVVFGGNAIVEGKVIGNVVVIGGDIRARSGSEIKGDAVVIGGSLDEDSDVIINGERVMFHKLFPLRKMWWWGPHTHWIKALFFPIALFVQLVLAFLVLLFLRDRIFRADEHLSGNFLKNFGIGLLSAFVGIFGIIIVTVALLITIIGIPLAILLIVSCIGVLIFAWTIFVYSLGRLVAEKLHIKSDSPFLLVFIGAVTLNIPSFVAFGFGFAFTPLALVFSVFAWSVKGFAYVCGIGALVLSRFGARPAKPVTTRTQLPAEAATAS